MTTRETHAMFLERTCFVCLATIPATKAMTFDSLRILACLGECTRIVNETWRDRSKSTRGRRRAKSDVLARLVARRTSST